MVSVTWREFHLNNSKRAVSSAGHSHSDDNALTKILQQDPKVPPVFPDAPLVIHASVKSWSGPLQSYTHFGPHNLHPCLHPYLHPHIQTQHLLQSLMATCRFLNMPTSNGEDILQCCVRPLPPPSFSPRLRHRCSLFSLTQGSVPPQSHWHHQPC